MTELPTLLRATASHARISHIDRQRLNNAADEIQRLTTELAKVTADYQTYVDGVDHAMDKEVKRLRLAVLFFAKHYDGPPDNMLSADERHLFAEPERIDAKENQ